MNLSTKRLIVRDWSDEDLARFAELNADPEVMRHFPEVLDGEQSDKLAKKIRCYLSERGWGFWAIEEKQSGEFIGFVGLHLQENEAIPHTPMVEIGWRLHRSYWRKGYATEAAEFCLRFAFEQLDAAEVYAFTALTNIGSQRVMQKIGMHNTKDNFEHPNVEEGSPVRTHCLYKISAEEWVQNINASKR